MYNNNTKPTELEITERKKKKLRLTNLLVAAT